MTTLLKPGFLVSLKTTIHGGIHYERTDLEAETREDGASIANWETKRVIDDPTEYQKATRARGAAGTAIRKVCTSTAFGLLCPESNKDALEAAIAAAQAIAQAHNTDAASTHVSLYVLRGRIASTDEEAARAIASEVRDLLSAMETGVRNADPVAIREAANRAKQLGTVLDAEQAEKVAEAVDQARKAARTIVKRIEKDGEAAEKVLRDISIASIEAARFSFLDFETPEQQAGEALPSVDLQRVASLELPEPIPAAPVSYEDALDAFSECG
jgi:hypothetical protein